MSDGFPQRVAHLFGRVLTAAPAERAALLAAHREREPDVVRRVEWMLGDRESELPTRVVNAPPAAAGNNLPRAPADAAPGAPAPRADPVAPASRRCPVAPDDDSAPLDAGAAPAAPRDAATPSGVFPGYEIVRRLSQGGQGVVYQAVETATKRKVALKVLLEGVHASKSARRRFEREIEIVAQFRHPHIISVLHAGQSGDGRQFYAMDYVRGEPLTTFVRSKKLPLDAALDLFATLCDAVQYAHQRGIIHRDLKPSNVLVDTEGRLRVLDFGLAKSLGATDHTLISLTGQAVGTLAYMSPEQTRGNPDEIDTRADVYALGVILYEILVGQYPYPVTGSIAETLNHIASTPPAPPSRNWKADSGVVGRASSRAGRCPIDADLETIVLKALSKERDRRYPGAGDLARDTRHYLAGEPIEARRDSALYVLRKTLARYRAAATVALVFVALLIAATGVSAWAYLQAERGRAVADFRLKQLRRIVNEDTLRSVQQHPTLRRNHDLATFAPARFSKDYPVQTLKDSDQWLHDRLPEWFSYPHGGQRRQPDRSIVPKPAYLERTVYWAPDHPEHERLYEFIRAHDPDIQEIIEKSRILQFDFNRIYFDDLTARAGDFVHGGGNGRALAHLLLARAAMFHLRGEDDVAAESITAARRGTRLVGSSPDTIGLLVDADIRTMLCHGVCTLAVAAAARGDDPRPYLDYIETDAPPLPLSLFLETEIAFLKQRVIEVFAPASTGGTAQLQEAAFRSQVWALDLIEPNAAQLQVPLPPDAEMVLERREMLSFEDTLQAIERLSEWSRRLDGLSPEEFDRAADADLGFALDNPLIRALFRVRPNDAILWVRRTHAAHDAAIVAVAIAVFRHRHERWPESIDEALQQVDVRPMASRYLGQPIVYRIDDGYPLLYWAGLDRQDNGGLPETLRQGGKQFDEVYVMPPALRARAVEKYWEALDFPDLPRR